jgi:sec-independent protein translocase protein TatA
MTVEGTLPMFTNFAFLDLSTPDLLIILAIILLLFGAKKLPELSKSLGTSARELRKGLSDVKDVRGELQQHVAETTGAVKAADTKQ